MTILSTSAFYEQTNLDLSNLRKQANTLQQQISTGQRLTASSDDPVAAARLRVLSRADSMSTVNTTNANRAMSDLKLADGVMQQIADNITQAQTLATQAANGTLSSDQRAAIGQQIANIRQNIITLANSKDSSGHTLFGGEGTGDAYTLDASGNPSYAGTASSDEVPLGDGQTVTRSVTGPEFLSFNTGSGSTDLFAVLGNLASALQGGSSDPAGAARGALDTLNSGLQKVTTTQTVIGGRMNWIDLNSARQQKEAEMRASEQSDVGSVDPTAAITQLQQIMTVLQASQASFVKLSGLSLFNVMN